MFLIIQHPFLDVRAITGNDSGRLSRPSWPLADPGKDFVRSAGVVNNRKKGGVSEWAGEEVYGNASSVFKFPPKFGSFGISLDKKNVNINCIFRRYYSDGIVSRLESGFKFKNYSAYDFSGKQLIKFLGEVLRTPIKVGGEKSNSKITALVGAGPQLAKHFLSSTTNHRMHASGNVKNWWFSCGLPSLIMEYPSWLPVKKTPRIGKLIDVESAGSLVSHTWIKVNNQFCSCWFVHRGAEGDNDAIRRLRIHLMRLHSERECLKLFLCHINDGDKFDLSNSFLAEESQKYLNRSLHITQKPKRFGINQSVILEESRSAIGLVFEGQMRSLDFMRRQVSEKVKLYIQNEEKHSNIIYNIEGNYMSTNIKLGTTTVNGDFSVITAENINNSFNKVEGSSASDEIKNKLSDLALEVAKLAACISSEDAEKLSKDFNIFSSEIISKNPRKEWYEISAKGIIEASKGFSELVNSVTTTVKDILSMLPS